MKARTYQPLTRGAAPIRSDPLLEIAMELERVATHDQYFVQRGLYPNVDFYSGIVLRALGVRPPSPRAPLGQVRGKFSSRTRVVTCRLSPMPCTKMPAQTCLAFYDAHVL